MERSLGVGKLAGAQRDLREVLRLEGIGSMCVLPLATAQRKLGALALGRGEKRYYTNEEVAFMQQVARPTGRAG